MTQFARVSPIITTAHACHSVASAYPLVVIQLVIVISVKYLHGSLMDACRGGYRHSEGEELEIITVHESF